MRQLFEFSIRTIAAAQGRDSFKMFDRIRNHLQRSRAEIDSHSLELLRHILIHAAGTTKAYKERFDSVGFDPQRLSDPQDIQRIPIVHKQDLRSHLTDFISHQSDLAKCQKKSTSGSSGQPLVFYRDREYFQIGQAGTMRNLALAGWEPGEAIGYVWGFEKDASPFINWKSFFSRTFYLNAFQQSPASMEEWVRTLKQYRVQYLYGYPSSLQWFAKFVKENALDLPMKAVFCTAEKYMEAEREDIEGAFRCKSYDLYGSSEIQNAAFECPQGRMHLSSDFVAAYDLASGTTDPPRLILTSFHNFCLPFICYDLGDYGRILDEPCACGIQTPLMEIYGGSRYDFLITRDGIVHGAVLERIFNKIEGVQRYQIIQHDLSKYTVRAEFTSRDLMAREVDSLEKTSWEVFQRIFGTGIEIRFDYPETIDPGPRGKFRFVVRDMTT